MLHILSDGKPTIIITSSSIGTARKEKKEQGGGDDRPTRMAWGWSLDAA